MKCKHSKTVCSPIGFIMHGQMNLEDCRADTKPSGHIGDKISQRKIATRKSSLVATDIFAIEDKDVTVTASHESHARTNREIAYLYLS